MSNQITQPLLDIVDITTTSYSDFIKVMKDNQYPVIYIDSNVDIRIEDGICYIDNSQIPLVDITILELVKKMRLVGINATLTDSKAGLIPAVMLVPFASSEFKSIRLDKSPYSLSEIYGSNTLNLVEYTDSSFIRDVLGILDQNGKNIDFTIKNNNVLIQSWHKDGINMLVKLQATKYLLFAGYESFINPTKLCTDHIDTYGVQQSLIDQ